jgi:hypothetical protein
MAIEIVDLPIKIGGSFHSFVNVYQGVTHIGKTSRSTHQIRNGFSDSFSQSTLRVDRGFPEICSHDGHKTPRLVVSPTLL